MFGFFSKKFNLLFIAAVRCVSLFPNRSFLLLCGEIEKILDPLMLQNFLLWMMLYLALKIALNFYFFNARSIQNKYPDISKLLQQLDSETIVIVTET